MTGLFSLTTRKPLAVLLSVLSLAGVGSAASAIALATAAEAARGHYQDLRSPDTRDAATRGAGVTAPRQDLRSPDARDAATHPRSTLIQPEPIVRVVKTTSDDFEWGDAAIGASGTLALMLVLAGAAAGWTRRRNAAAGHLTAAS
jgi:hypothetical protein